MRGGKATPPDWAIVLQFAQQYNVPPWEFEERCSADWWNRMIVYRMVESEEANRRAKKAKRGKKHT